jgi:rod shape-determining protein MreD
MINQSQFILLVKITILAFIVGAVALPSILDIISPFWLLLFFIYWLIYSDSDRIYSAAFVLGILLDVFQGGILGQNALALLISSAFILSVKKSFFVSNLTTQQVYVFIASLSVSHCIFNYSYCGSRNANRLACCICSIYWCNPLACGSILTCKA